MQSRFSSNSGLSSNSNTNQILYNNCKYLQLQIRNIKAAKKDFLNKLSIIDKNIESVTQNVLNYAVVCEQTLKSHLEDVRKAKNLEWMRQIKLCEDAEKILRSTENSSLESVSLNFAKNIGLIDAGEIKFFPRVCLLRKEIENFGKLSIGEKTLSAKFKPRLIIGRCLKEFNRPWGVCFDATRRILVTDRDNHRVQVFNEYGKFLFSFGKLGSGFGEFNSPTGIAVDKKFRIIVSDRKNHRVQVFTFTGKFLFSFGRRGARAGEFQHPWDVTVNEGGEIAVSDNRNQRIQLFSTRGQFILQFCFGKNNFGLKKRVRPRGVAFRPDGSLLVADVRNSCILLIDKFFSTATIVGGNVHGFKPQAVSCNRSGMFAISDIENKKIQVFEEGGNLYNSFDVQEFGCLLGVCLLPDGGFIAADFEGNRVLIF